MKRFLKIFFLLPILVSALLFTGCDSDDNGGNDPGVNPLIGTWNLTQVKGMFQGYLVTLPAATAGVEATITTTADGDYTAIWTVSGDSFTDEGQWYSDETNITLVTVIDGETVTNVWPYELADEDNTFTVTVNAQDIEMDEMGLSGEYDLTFIRQ